jgi:uncharacterized protein (TIGR03437 family)
MVSYKAVWFILMAGLVVPGIAFGYAEGPLPGYAGVPGELGTCSECHTGGVGTGHVSISFSGGTSYTPGVTQQLIVTIVDSVQRRWGFELASRLASSPSTQEGAFTAGTNGYTQVICADSNFDESLTCPSTAFPLEYIEQTSVGTQDGTVGSGSFTFTWTPPASSVGNITFYIAANAANGDGTDEGDHIYTNTYTLTPATSPQITSVVNGATFQSTMAASTYLTIFGNNLATSTTDWSSAFVNGAAPTTLGGATVSVAGASAYIAYASPTQLNIVAPTISSSGNAVSVTVAVGGQQSAAFPVTLQSSGLAPSFFFWQPANANANLYLVAQHADSSDVGKVGLFPGNSPATTPAKPGEEIVLYGTGFGPTTPAITPGTLTSQANTLNNPYSATVGNIPAAVQFAGLAGDYCELYQVNLSIPASITSTGDYPVVLLVNGVQSFSGLITVQP